MKRFAIIGLGKFGYHIAETLFLDHHEVIAIDRDKAKVQAIDAYATKAIVMDATSKETLMHLGLETMDAVIVATGINTNASIMICLHLQEIGVQNILAKAQDIDHGKILKRVGATEVIHPERDMAIRIAHGLSRPNVLDFIPLGQDFNLLQIISPASFTGKSLKELNIRAEYDVHVIAIKEALSHQVLLIPGADYPIREGDTLIILGKHDDIDRFEKLK
ncbi:TrkA family potassium uptake protein [bacterium]|nr:TrkA family potassium uptake protein [candidate division CSSED10-310 bacterium]